MALTLVHDKFKALLDTTTGGSAYPVYIPRHASYPAYAFAQDALSRDIDSRLRVTSISTHSFTVFVAHEEYAQCHAAAQALLNKLDQHSDSDFALVLVEDCQDGFDPDMMVYMKTLTITMKHKEQ
ncbi:hypothetical protein CGH02_17020 [Vibrio parahaemolyticus]|uniref:hypothetical protein n=1 Tax=Vibrio parahaemolyticus TaxID=670 RepID=UPI000986981B|nr:hypothetical protein [Vibrio parahaemolyticus]OOI08410.1 hypothetical protein BIW15_11035 [Vibrio sp. SALL6]ELF4876455.1 hypothetical protein [Vibrio parahaemolyticus]TOE16184.1 hypothetical protein CGJ50_01965 [Vibrio parahaemolyticus]TOI00940.1 hypothetical protein CGI69_18740 [Vibrio parahaemolyticus]TOJ04416.1 hypothetical protein CGI48_09185 [Vibrio parahaemolyticus]